MAYAEDTGDFIKVAEVAAVKVGTTAAILTEAELLLGAPYAEGEVSPDTGFDCSGLVYCVFNKDGIVILRTLAGQFAAGENVEFYELMKVNLVFFEVYGKGMFGNSIMRNKLVEYLKTGQTHIVIYIGNGRFIHAPKHGNMVKTANLKKIFWCTHLRGRQWYIIMEENYAEFAHKTDEEVD